MSEIKRTLLELVVVAFLGLVFGLTANAAYKDGLSLTSDYFRGVTQLRNDADPEAVIKHLEDLGLVPITFEDVVVAFEDPLYEAEAYVFVDARDDQNYTDGHIPGALQLDHYRIEDYIDEVLSYCQAAEKIIVYCTGGECDDSEFAALALRDEFGVDPEKLYVFVGGLEEWIRNKMPVERGERLSGDIGGSVDE